MTVAIATFGDPRWEELAEERALPSAFVQNVPIARCHGKTLADARNGALESVSTEWVIYLDADDELEAGYVDAMAAGSADLRAPAVRYIRGRRVPPPAMPRVAGHRHACEASCLRAGNWLVIGTAVRAELLRSVGGWEEFGWSEDWAMWARCWKAGATVEAIPAAVYRAHVDPTSRNRAADRAEKLRWHREIESAVFA